MADLTDSKKHKALEVAHRHHALGDEMHIYTCVWFLSNQYDEIIIHCDYQLMNKSRGSNYETYIKPFIEGLYKNMHNVKLIHQSNKGIEKERLGKLIPAGTNVELPTLMKIEAFPLEPRLFSARYILVPTRIRYPPANIKWNEFYQLIGQVSQWLQIVFIGEQKLDRENHEIFTIYDGLTKHFNDNALPFVDLTAQNNLYKGESQLNHLYRDLNLARHADYVVTVGISGFIDICSLTSIVYTIGSFNQPYTKLIWNNTEHRRLQVCKNMRDMTSRLTQCNLRRKPVVKPGNVVTTL